MNIKICTNVCLLEAKIFYKFKPVVLEPDLIKKNSLNLNRICQVLLLTSAPKGTNRCVVYR